MNEYLNKFDLRELNILNCHTHLKFLLEDENDDNVCSQLVNAAEQIEEVSTRKLLTLLLSKERVKELDLSSKPTSVPKSLKSVASELRHAVQVSKAVQTGFIYDEKKKNYRFNANLFAKYFLTRLTVVFDEYGLIFAYNKKGFYKELSSEEMGQLVHKLMNDGVANSWRTSHEKEAIEAIKRECLTLTKMDCMNDYINLKNGMYRLSTGVLEPHHPSFLSTVQIPIQFDVEATCPKFTNFMNEITYGDIELIAVHQEIVGYLLSAEIKCEKAFYYYGWGANGKSVLAKIISVLVGEQNVSSIPLSQFNSEFGLEAIVGKRVNIASENESKGSHLNTEELKAIVSGDGMTISRKYRTALTNYKSVCRQLFLGNSLPKTSDLSNGFFRRMFIIPFARNFSEEEQNRNLIDELTDEMSGIFNWAVIGLNRLNKQNFNFSHSQAIEIEHAKYVKSLHPVRSFYEEMVELNEESKVKRVDVYDLYSKWYEEQDLSSQTKHKRNKFYTDFNIMIDSQRLPIQMCRIQGYEYFRGIQFRVA